MVVGIVGNSLEDILSNNSRESSLLVTRGALQAFLGEFLGQRIFPVFIVPLSVRRSREFAILRQSCSTMLGVNRIL